MSDALAGVIVGGLLGVLGTVLGAAITGRHARQLADADRVERIQREVRDHQRDVYVSLGRHASRTIGAARVEQIAADYSEDDDSMRELAAMINVYGSRELRRLMRLYVTTFERLAAGEASFDDVKNAAVNVVVQIRHEVRGGVGWYDPKISDLPIGQFEDDDQKNR